MSEFFDTNVNFQQNQLENTVAHRMSSYPSGAREGQWIYHLTNKTFCVCINDTINTSSPLAWKCFIGFTDPEGIRDVDCTEITDIRDAVYLTGENAVAPAIATGIANSKVFGFVKSKESSTKCTIVTEGILDGFSELNMDKPYFLSKQFNGGITDIVITGSENVVTHIGKAFTSTKLFIDIKLPMIRS